MTTGTVRVFVCLFMYPPAGWFRFQASELTTPGTHEYVSGVNLTRRPRCNTRTGCCRRYLGRASMLRARTDCRAPFSTWLASSVGLSYQRVFTDSLGLQVKLSYSNFQGLRFAPKPGHSLAKGVELCRSLLSIQATLITNGLSPKRRCSFVKRG